MSTLSAVSNTSAAVNYRSHSQPPLSTLRAVTLSFQSVAFLTTIYRLVFRYRTRRLWWDDFWAFSALVFDIAMVVALMVYIQPGESHKSRVIAIWIKCLAFTVALWLARVSLAIAIVRISPPASSMRRSAMVMAILFGLIGLALLLQKVIYCSHEYNWIMTPLLNPICELSVGVFIANVCTDLIANILLILIPIKTLWRSKFDPKHRRLVLVLCTASAISAIASLPQAVTQIWIDGSFRHLTGQVEAAMALAVCNLLALVMHFYRVFRHGEDIEAAYDYSLHKTRIPTPNIDMSTVADVSAFDSGLTSVHYTTDDQQSQLVISINKSEKSMEAP